jgi:Protein of unknown function (DUF2971)
VTAKRIPSHLYKYQPFTPQTIANLKDASIWFSAPIAFNDPFDCSLPVVDISRLTYSDFRRALEYLKGHRTLSTQLTAEMCPNGIPTQAFRDVFTRSVTEIFAERRKVQLESRGVACFSAKSSDIMMWSHYADGHRGFCLEFDSAIEPFSKALPVRYREDFPYINPVDVLVEPHTGDPENHLLGAMVLTKAPCWNYEQEWRIMHMEPSKLYTYDYHALTGIYFGAEMPFAHIEILSLILRDAPTRSYKVSRNERGFSLEAEPVTYTPFAYTPRS